MIVWQFVALLAVHWFADFVLQTHWQASNKSKNIEALGRHVATYWICLAVATPFIFGIPKDYGMFVFVVLNTALHFATDYVTSRWSASLWAKQDWHNFFVMIGFDQLIHQVTLAATMLLFFGSAA